MDTHKLSLVNQHKARRTRLKSSAAQRLASPHRPRPIPKTTMATAKHSVLRGCKPRYTLALKVWSKVSDTSRISVIRSRLNRHLKNKDVAFVVSQNLTTSENDSHTLHTWLDKRVEAKRKASSLTSSTSTLTRFKNEQSLRTPSSARH